MATVSFTTPKMVTAKDYHDLEFLLCFLNDMEPSIKLGLYEDEYGNSDWFFDGSYHAIVYAIDEDEKQARKLYKTFKGV